MSKQKKPVEKAGRQKDEFPVQIKTHSDKNGGHPHVILENFRDGRKEMHVSVGLSTKKRKGNGSTNYALEKSPLNDGKNSYMRRQGTVDIKESYKRPRWGSMTSKDYTQAKVYGVKAKRKYFGKKT